MYKADRLPPNHNFKSKMKLYLMIFFAKIIISTRPAPTEEAGEKGINVLFSGIKDKGCAKLSNIIGQHICNDKGAATTPLATQSSAHLTQSTQNS